jgi:hypothetical protein
LPPRKPFVYSATEPFFSHPAAGRIKTSKISVRNSPFRFLMNRGVRKKIRKKKQEELVCLPRKKPSDL